ncbi:MAG: agarase, partial [Planctomycetota bacterium]
HFAELAEERNLIGYFYSDCPTWTHDRPDNQWRGPIFDPDRLKTTAGQRELRELATSYYKTIHDAIRRYDKHHLLLGDRYEANAPIAMEMLEAAIPYVDALSFQDFKDPVTHLEQWHRRTGKPVLLADAAGVNFRSQAFFKPNNGSWYADTLLALHKNPGCIGFHLCGAYQRNKARRRGLLDEMENADQQHVDQMMAANARVTQMMAQLSED